MRRAGLLVLGCLALVCLVGTSAFGSRTLPQASQDDPGARRPFIHRDHVPAVWANGTSPETRRDCRGCHLFEEDRTRDPQAVCSECHISSEENRNTFRAAFAEGWETLDGYRNPESSFRHFTHAALTCRECHQPEDKIPSDPMPIRRGSAACTRCHGPANAESPPEFEVLQGEAPLIPDTVRRQLLDELNGSPNMSPDSLGPFLHSEHLSDPSQSFDLATLVGEGSKQGVCTSCHAPVQASGVTDLHGERFLQDSCGECHIGRSGPLRFGADPVLSESLAALTFSHADHLAYDVGRRDPARSNARGYDRIEGEGCHACHTYDSKARTFLATDNASHEGCRSCHDSSSFEAEQHGDWQGWGCTACHSFEREGELVADRPMATVRRRRSSAFVIESQVHPHIAGADPSQLFEGNCSQCHRAQVEELPSRIGTRPFSHATHLPADATAEHCDACHGARLREAYSSDAISTAFAGRSIDPSDTETAAMLGSTYDMGACARCHRGGVREEVSTTFEEIPSTQVPEFSHADHLGKRRPDGTGLDCTTCHELPDRPGARMVTLPRALDCTECHNHRAGEGESISGEASAEELSRCGTCHIQAIPAAGGTLQVERARLTSLIGSEGQFHPDDRDCTACHEAAWSPFAEAEAIAEDHVFAVGGRSRNGRLVERHQHRGQNTSIGFLRNIGGVDCLWCHWAQGIPNFDFESEAYRQDKGNVIQIERDGVVRSFPGGGYREQYEVR